MSHTCLSNPAECSEHASTSGCAAVLHSAGSSCCRGRRSAHESMAAAGDDGRCPCSGFHLTICSDPVPVYEQLPLHGLGPQPATAAAAPPPAACQHDSGVPCTIRDCQVWKSMPSALHPSELLLNVSQVAQSRLITAAPALGAGTCTSTSDLQSARSNASLEVDTLCDGSTTIGIAPCVYACTVQQLGKYRPSP